MVRRGGDAYWPYHTVMVGALPPFVGDIVYGGRHHKLDAAIAEANRWCDAVAGLGCEPWWPYSFGVLDARDGSYPHMTDETERNDSAKRTRTQVSGRGARYRREGRPG